MTAISQLYAYLTQTNPNPPAGSCAANILNSLQAGSPGLSLESLCSTNGDTAFIQANPDVFDVLLGDNEMNGIGSYRADSGNTTIENDIDNLQTDLNAYNNNPNVTTAEAVGNCINRLESDVKTAFPQLSDGYLTTLLNYLNAPTQGGIGSLAYLASNCEKDPTDFMAALNGLGEGSSGGGNFSDVIADVINWEYNEGLD